MGHLFRQFTDPLLYASGLNLYTYSLNDPLNVTDSLGLVPNQPGLFPSPITATPGDPGDPGWQPPEPGSTVYDNEGNGYTVNPDGSITGPNGDVYFPREYTGMYQTWDGLTIFLEGGQIYPYHAPPLDPSTPPFVGGPLPPIGVGHLPSGGR